MEILALFSTLRQHAAWADRALVAALSTAGEGAARARREMAHLVGAEEVWLARIEGRRPRTAIWPDLGVRDIERQVQDNARGYQALLARLRPAELKREIAYANSAGKRFATALGDILMHVAMHGQYHRGKVNQLLREGGFAPAPADYIAFVRDAPAART